MRVQEGGTATGGEQQATEADEAVKLVPPKIHTLESAIEFIAEDELVEVTPTNIRIRKRVLKEQDRRRLKR